MFNKRKNILTDVPKHQYVETAKNINKAEFIKVIKDRRSVRVFTDEPVIESDIKEKES